MKNLFTILLLLLSLLCFARENPYAKIDKYAASVGYLPSNELAEKLTSPYHSDSEKVRSIFYWITQHIAYDVYEYHHPVTESYYTSDFEDSLKAEAALSTKYGEEALRKKMGICEGYADLFKLLCEHSHIKCETICGSGKTRLNEIGIPFEENHAWNAVKINGKWKLIDVCWASGEVNANTTKFTKAFNEYYYCTPPTTFALSHYPSNINWLLTGKQLSKSDFVTYPLLDTKRPNLMIDVFTPQNGAITAKLGDTLNFEITVSNGLDSFSASYGSYISEYDATGKAIKKYAGLTKSQRFRSTPKKIFYEYKVTSAKVTELTLVYNDDFLFSYKLAVKK